VKRLLDYHLAVKVAEQSSASPLRITDHTAVLILQILRICFDINHIPLAGIGIGRTRRIRARNRPQMRHRRIQLCVLIEYRRGLFGTRSCCSKRGFQNQCLIGTGWRKGLIVTTVATEHFESTCGLIQVEVIAANRTETERHRADPMGGCG
jgi:hypothetical protein